MEHMGWIESEMTTPAANLCYHRPQMADFTGKNQSNDGIFLDAGQKTNMWKIEKKDLPKNRRPSLERSPSLTEHLRIGVDGPLGQLTDWIRIATSICCYQ